MAEQALRHLDWRNFVELGDFGDPEKNRQIEEALDQMMLTDEGRQQIWRAADLHGGKIKIEPADPKDPNHRNHYDYDKETVFIDFSQIKSRTYFTENSESAEKFSLQRVLRHEMDHAANPRLTLQSLNDLLSMRAIAGILDERGDTKNAAYFKNAIDNFVNNNEPLPDDVVEKLKDVVPSDISFEDVKKWLENNPDEKEALGDRLAEPDEVRTIHKTNKVMEKYYGEEPRQGHNGGRICDPGEESATCLPPSSISDKNKEFYEREDMNKEKIPGYKGEQKGGGPSPNAANDDPLLDNPIKTSVTPSAAFSAAASGQIQDVPVPEHVKTNDPVYRQTLTL